MIYVYSTLGAAFLLLAIMLRITGLVEKRKTSRRIDQVIARPDRRRSYFTIEGIDDDICPPAHPDVLKFHDFHTADWFNRMINPLFFTPEEMERFKVQEHLI